MIELDDVSYWYPATESPALDDITWRVGPGLTVVAGESGSGKSTLLRLLNGLVPHFYSGRIRGRARVAGCDIWQTPTRQMARHVGFVFQDPEMQSVAATVERDIAFGPANLGIPARELRGRVDETLALTGLEGFATRTVRSLSGGERQRVALAGALALRPAIIVFDEPLSQLDTAGATALVTVCQQLAQSGRTVVMSEHRWSELPASARVTLLAAGRITGVTSVDQMRDAIFMPEQHVRRPGAQRWSVHNLGLIAGDRPVLDGVDLGGCAGEVVALTGQNGSGKTTLLRALAGVIEPVSGRVDTMGTRVGYLPQNPGALLHRETIRDELAVALRRSRSPDTPEYWLDVFGLGALAQRFPRDLSSGERQRAALATLVATRPGVLLLDEPTRGMDAGARHQLITAIDELCSDGCSVVIATHDNNLITALGARRLELSDGRVRETTARALVPA